MFWSSPASQSTIDELLDQEDLTIQKLLDDDNILQKCHEKDPRLIAFLCRAENVEYLVNQITNPPTSDEFDPALYRHPSLACEIMTCDISPLSDHLVQTEMTLAADRNGSCSEAIHDSVTAGKSSTGVSSSESLSNSDMNTSSVANGTKTAAGTDTPDPLSSASSSRPLLDRFFNTLRAPLNPLSASFLCRILVHLSVHRGHIVIPYMRASANFLECMLSHFHLSVLPDVLIQMAQQERGLQKSVFEWFREDRLVSRLIELFAPTNSSEVHESAAHCLVQLIITLRNYLRNNAASNREANATTFDTGLPPNSPYAMLVDDDEVAYTAAVRLLDVLESEDSMNAILTHLTNEATVTTSVAVNCIDVLITLMDKRKSETGFAPSESAPGMELDQILSGPGNPSQPSFGRANHANVGDGSEQKGDQSASTEKTRVAQACSNLAKACLPRLHHLHTLLQRPHLQACNHMITTYGPLDPPLGMFRLMLAQFLALLVALPLDTGLAEGLVKEGVVKSLMDLFEQYPFNTLLHQSVTEFLLALFSHTRVIVPKRNEPKEGPRESRSEQLSQASTDTKSNNSNDDKMDVDTQTASYNQSMDDAFVAIVKDYRITDWCLRLFKSLSNISCHPSNGFNAANEHVPKPGYTGHLWRLANSIEEARNGARRDFVRTVFQNLSPESLSSWEQFVSTELARINTQQAAEDVVIENPEQKNSALRMFIQQNVSSWLSQSSSIIDLSSAVSGSGKLSLLLGPLAFGGGTSAGLVCATTSGDQLDLSFRTQFGASKVDSDDSYLEPSDPSANLWINTDDTCGQSETSVLNDVIGFGDSQDGTTLKSEGFRRARIASLSSDEGESDEEIHPGLDSHDSDDDDEEEDLHSPMVIKQQRSGAPQIEPVIASTNLVRPWDYGHSAASMADVSTDNLYAWANFDDNPPKSPHASDQPTGRGTCDRPTSSVNGSGEKERCGIAQHAPKAVDTIIAGEIVEQHSPSRKSMP